MFSTRAPAVAILMLIATLSCVSAAWADSGTPPPTTPTSTTPDAPPPDPYQPPAKTSKPKPATKPAVVHSAPVYRAPVRTYTPPLRTYTPPVRPRTVQPQRVSHPRRAKAVHRHKARVVHRRVAPKPEPKPVKVTFNPFANLVAASTVLATTDGTSDRDRYLRLAGLAFAVLAVSALSLQLLATRAATT